MALILERYDARRGEVLRRVLLERLPVTVGRSLDNDVILDDPHVDAHHARIVAGEDGTPVMEDLASVNGIEIPGTGRQSRVLLAAGTTLRLGRTALRIRDRAEEVAPALALGARAAIGHWVEQPRWQLALIALVFLGSADSAWVATHDREGMTTTLALIVAVAALLALWAGAWAVVGKLAIRRAAFVTHVAIASLAAVVLNASELVTSWAQFLFPATGPALGVIGTIVTVGVSAANLDMHLAFSTALTRRRRWIGVASVVGGLALLVAAFAAVKDDAFTDVPTFLYGLKRAPAAVIPAGDLDDFRRATEALRVKVDSLKPRPTAAAGR